MNALELLSCRGFCPTFHRLPFQGLLKSVYENIFFSLKLNKCAKKIFLRSWSLFHFLFLSFCEYGISKMGKLFCSPPNHSVWKSPKMLTFWWAQKWDLLWWFSNHMPKCALYHIPTKKFFLCWLWPLVMNESPQIAKYWSLNTSKTMLSSH